MELFAGRHFEASERQFTLGRELSYEPVDRPIAFGEGRRTDNRPVESAVIDMLLLFEVICRRPPQRYPKDETSQPIQVRKTAPRVERRLTNLPGDTFRHGRQQRSHNFWGFTHDIPNAFYDASTGIEPVDHVIRKVLRTEYCHHIERQTNFWLDCSDDDSEIAKVLVTHGLAS